LNGKTPWNQWNYGQCIAPKLELGAKANKSTVLRLFHKKEISKGK
jgi:hypothetical protein